MKSANVLLVDDDSDSLISLTRVLKSLNPSFSFSAASTEDSALKLLSEDNSSVVVMDLCIDNKRGPESGFSLLRRILSIDPTVRVIVLTGFGTNEAGIRCLDLGASSFLEKPPDPPHLSALIKDSARQSEIKRANIVLSKKLADPIIATVIGTSEHANKLRSELQYAASTHQPVLLLGETGTGKGLCARIIHKLSDRAQQNFVRYQPNFATADLVNSELFGHLRGAFTGADANRTGLIEEANHGTLFLDEINELPIESQISLLGVLQDRKFRPLGSNTEVESNFRLISATNGDIESSIATKKFRADLFHRVAHVQISLPPLRERIIDIPSLADHFLNQLRERESLSVFEITAPAMSKLASYSWPGNIRELECAIENGAYRAQFQQKMSIEPEHLTMGKAAGVSKNMLNFNDRVEEYKVRLIKESLSRHSGNQVKAALELEMDRSTLRRILERTGTIK